MKSDAYEQMNKKFEILDKSPIMEGFPSDRKLGLVSNCTVKQFAPGKVVCRAGRETDFVFVVHSGQAQELPPNFESGTSSGTSSAQDLSSAAFSNERIFSHGDVIGGDDALLDDPFSRTVTAVAPLTVLSMKKEDYLGIKDIDRDIAEAELCRQKIMELRQDPDAQDFQAIQRLLRMIDIANVASLVLGVGGLLQHDFIEIKDGAHKMVFHDCDGVKLVLPILQAGIPSQTDEALSVFGGLKVQAYSLPLSVCPQLFALN